MQAVTAAPVFKADLPPNVAASIHLKKPLPGHQGPITVINLREPTLGDMVACGELMQKIAHDVRGEGGTVRLEIREDHQALMRWMVALSSVPEPILSKMSLPDARAVTGEVMRIVGEVVGDSAEGNSRR